MKRRLAPPAGQPLHFSLEPCGLPEIPFIAAMMTPWETPELGRHAHPGAMEICYLVKGEQIYSVGGRDYVVRGNEVFWVFADEEHSSGGKPFGRGMLYWLHVRLPRKREPFLTMTAREAEPLVEALRSLPQRHFGADRRLQKYFEEIHELSRGGQDIPPLDRLRLARLVVEWLCILVECGHGAAARGRSADIIAALNRIEADATHPFSVSELAQWAGLSESRFKAKFRAEVGMPPGEYVLRRRIKAAEELLRSSQELSITQVAHRFGFSSSQYFATAYKRVNGCSPNAARQPLRAKP